MQFLHLAEELACFARECRLGGGDHAKKMFCFLCLFHATPDGAAKILFRNAFICLAIVRADTRAAANKLINQPVVCRVAWDFFENRTIASPNLAVRSSRSKGCLACPFPVGASFNNKTGS